jgi:hypothetical protein
MILPNLFCPLIHRTAQTRMSAPHPDPSRFQPLESFFNLIKNAGNAILIRTGKGADFLWRYNSKMITLLSFKSMKAASDIG